MFDVVVHTTQLMQSLEQSSEDDEEQNETKHCWSNGSSQQSRKRSQKKPNRPHTRESVSLRTAILEEGIKHEFSALYTPQQICVVERKNGTLIDIPRTMMGEYKTQEQFLSEAVNTACQCHKLSLSSSHP
jgi:hypothetical protein